MANSTVCQKVTHQSGHVHCLISYWLFTDTAAAKIHLALIPFHRVSLFSVSRFGI